MMELERRLAAEDGFTLVELLLAMVLMLVVMSAALLGLQTMQALGKRNSDFNDAQQAARLGSDTLNADLRNMASPTPSNPAAVDSASADNLIFQVVNKTPPAAPPSVNVANVMRIRYCYDATNQILWNQTQVWGDATPAVPANSAGAGAPCPQNSGWTTTKQLASFIVNDPTTQPVFTYNSATATAINQVNTQLVVDINAATKPPAPVALSSGVFLRNQNQAPTSSFGFTVLGSKLVRFNGTLSSDPEGSPLSYYWYTGASPTCPLPSNFADPESTPLPGGQSSDIVSIRNVAVPDYTFSSTGTKRVVLVVKDPGGLMACSAQTIDVQ
jgi:prepilin-type N-terminal cleavage/methylation domain-containing protein